MHKKNVFIFLFNGFSDWELAYLLPEINKSDKFDLIYFSTDGKPVLSMGGMQVLPSISLQELIINEVDMLILPGGTAWEAGENREIDSLVTELFSQEKALAAICAATTYLGKLGLLNNLKHTSNHITYLKSIVPEYSGDSSYIDALAVSDKNIITANGIAPIEFAKEIFKKLSLKNDNDIEKWFQLFKNGIWSE